MSLAFLNGHTRQGTLSADIVSATTVQADTIETGAVVANVATYDTLTVNVAATLSGTLTFAGPLTFDAVTFSGAATFQNDVTINAGHAVTVSSPVTLAAGATLPPGAVVSMTGASISGSPALSNCSVPAASTLTMTGAFLAGNPQCLNGLRIASGQALTMTGASITGTPAISAGATLSSGQTLTFTGATLAGGGTGAITGLSTLNGVPATVCTLTGYGGPARVSAVFPRMTAPASGTGIYIVDNLSFTGQASNGTDPGTPRGASVATAAAQITEVDGFGLGLIHFRVFNRSPYTFYCTGPGILSSDEQSPSGAVWWPMTFARFSRATAPTAGDYTGWRVETEPLNFVSGWITQSTAILSSADCTFSAFRAQYSVTACKPSGDALGARVAGQVLIHFTTAAPTDPVRIQMPLPVGPQATSYSATAGFAPAVNFFRDWVVSSTGTFAENLPAYVGAGELARDLTTYARSDATARVAAYLEDGDANVGYLRIVVSGFTGGAGTYKLRCNYELQCDNIQYRATYPTFSTV